MRKKNKEAVFIEDIGMLVRNLVEKHGTYNSRKLIQMEGIRLIIRPMELSGLYLSTCCSQIIIINSELTLLGKIVTMLHELAHALLHPNEDFLFMRDHIYWENDRIENEAHKFAAHVLFNYPHDIELEPGDEELLKKLRNYL